MKDSFNTKPLIRIVVIALWGCSSLIAFGQQPVKKPNTPPSDDPKIAQQQELIGRLMSVANELKGESDKPGATLLQSEVADILWKFDEPAARSIFRIAFDSIRQDIIESISTSDINSKSDSRIRLRQRMSALRLILKRYGLRDRKAADALLQEFENDLTLKQTGSNNATRVSPEQAELLTEIAVGLVPTNPKEAARLGALAVSAARMPSGFGRLLMALRDTDKSLSDVVFRQALLSMRSTGFPYDSALISVSNYSFFSNGSRFPDMSPQDVGLIVQFFVDAASAQAVISRSAANRTNDEQSALGSFYNFLNNRVVRIVNLHAPEKSVLLQSNIAEIGRALTLDQRRQAEAYASLAQSNSDRSDSDLESRIRRAEQEKNSSTRDSLFRNLAVQLMRTEPERALELAAKIDDRELRAHTEDDVYLVLMRTAFSNGPSAEAKVVALKFNDLSQRAKWLAQVAARTKDQAEAAELLSQAHSIATKSDNTPLKLDLLLFIGKEFLRFDQQRGFEVLTDAVNVTNRLEKVPAKSNKSFVPVMRIVSITVVDGQEVSTDDRVTLNSIDFNQIGAFVERDYLRTTFLANDIKDRFLRSKYVIALARSVLNVPRQGSGYERTFEDLISN